LEYHISRRIKVVLNSHTLKHSAITHDNLITNTDCTFRILKSYDVQCNPLLMQFSVKFHGSKGQRRVLFPSCASQMLAPVYL